MILIIGGAYQGKLDFAKETYGVAEEQVHTCTDGEIDFSKRCIYHLETFAAHHTDPVGYLKSTERIGRTVF